MKFRKVTQTNGQFILKCVFFLWRFCSVFICWFRTWKFNKSVEIFLVPPFGNPTPGTLTPLRTFDVLNQGGSDYFWKSPILLAFRIKKWSTSNSNNNNLKLCLFLIFFSKISNKKLLMSSRIVQYQNFWSAKWRWPSFMTFRPLLKIKWVFCTLWIIILQKSPDQNRVT